MLPMAACIEVYFILAEWGRGWVQIWTKDGCLRGRG
jgi:hypothetical protein